jgi:uncharacterized protein YndB with AHSA1/START domain
MSMPLTITDTISIAAPAEKVWDALTNPALTQQYMFGCEALSDWKEGSRLVWRGAKDGVDYVTGHITRLEPHTHFSYTVFDPNGKYEDIPANYLNVDCVLKQAGENTLLQVTQGDYSLVAEGQERYNDSADGWGSVLEGLKKVAEEM